MVEPTSGNTGVGLALVAQQRGYSASSWSRTRWARTSGTVLQAYGAEVVVTPTAVAPDSPQSYYGVSDRLVTRDPGCYKPDQFSNPNGPLATTRPPARRSGAIPTARSPTSWSASAPAAPSRASAATCKEVSADRPEGGAVKIIGADPAGSVYSGGTGRPYLVEGVGEDMWPATYDPSVPDEIIAVSDAEVFAMTRRLAREEGLLVGGSTGMAVVAALNVARDLGAGRHRRRDPAGLRPRLPGARSSTTTGCSPTAS